MVGKICPFLCCNILLLLLIGSVSAQTITATVGSEATLRCHYDVKYHGRLYACWGRGDLPFLGGCWNEVIETNGRSVTRRLSDKYQMLGDQGRGDVSLTIRRLQERDSGKYGCRVHLTGWFNDQKSYVTLKVVPGRPTPPSVSTREVKDRTVTVSWRPAFNGGRPINRYSIEIKEERLSWNSAKRTDVLSSSQTDLVLMDLHPAKTYNLRMFAANIVGRSGASNVVTLTTKEAAPEGPPLDVQLESLSSSSINVSWKAPHPELRNGVLISYSISYREFGQMGKAAGGWRHLRKAATQESHSLILRNLKPSTNYSVMVQALTAGGIGPGAISKLCSTLDEVVTTSPELATNSTAAPVTADPYATSWVESTTAADQLTGLPPDPPVLELKEAQGNTITIAWIPAAFEGDSPVSGFYLESKTANASWDNTKMVVDFIANETEATLVELNPATYNIRMFAKSESGTSNASNVLTVTTGEAVLLPEDLQTTVSTNVEAAAASASESQGDLLVWVMVPLALVVLPLAAFIAWKVRRMRQEKEDEDLFYSSGFLRFKNLGSQEDI